MKVLSAATPIVRQDRTMEQQFREYMTTLGKYVPIIGAGSPEGLVEAPQFSLYIDEAGGTGTIEYRKMQAHIGGDRSKGWVLV